MILSNIDICINFFNFLQKEKRETAESRCEHSWPFFFKCYLLNFSLEYAIRKVQETDLEQDMNSTLLVVTYAVDVHLVGDDIITKRNVCELLNNCKDIGLAAYVEKKTTMEIGRQWGTDGKWANHKASVSIPSD